MKTQSAILQKLGKYWENMFTVAVFAIIYFVIIRFLLWLLLGRYNDLIGYQLRYHHSDGLTWYTIWLGVPITIAWLAGMIWKPRILQRVGQFLLPLMFIGTGIGIYVNAEYWGYHVRRPDTFSELRNVKTVVNISDADFENDSLILQEQDPEELSDQLYARENPYYAVYSRGLMTMIDYASYTSRVDEEGNSWRSSNNARRWHSMLLDSSRNVSPADLQKLGHVMLTSGISKKPAWIAGIRIMKLITTEEDSFFYAALGSHEVENDHYYVWEFLISDEEKPEIFNSITYCYDLAGREHMEYANLAPIGETVLLVFSLILALVVTALRFLIQKLRKNSPRHKSVAQVVED